MIIVVFGLPASGKTFLAEELSKQFECRHLNTDVLRKQFIKKPKYTQKEKKAVYDNIFSIAAEELRKGNCVVLDGTFYKSALRKKASMLAKKYADECVFVQLIVSDKEAKKRILERKKEKTNPSEATFAVFKKIKKEFQPMKKEHLEIDSTIPLRKQVEKVHFYLKRRGLIE